MADLIINSEPALQSAIGDLLAYDQASGVLTWRVARGRCAAGSIAGYDTGRGYVGVRVLGRCDYVHRVAFLLMTGRSPKFVDHISGDRADNRWVNLREVDRSGNGKNMKRPDSNRSGVVGVFWNSCRGKWTARIKSRQITTHLGHFDSFDLAVRARKDAEHQLGFHQNHGRNA